MTTLTLLRDRVLADANAAFNPPKVHVVAEDGTTLDLPDADALTISLTPTLKTRLAGDITGLQMLANMVAGKLPRSPEALAVLRAHSPLLDELLSIAERLR